MFRSLLRSLKLRLLPGTDVVTYEGVVLPPKHRRYCGAEFHDDAFYLRSAVHEATRVACFAGSIQCPRIVDIGSGQGRLALGLMHTEADVNYLGLDVDEASIRWCRKHIGGKRSSFRFEHLNVRNARYNTNGAPLTSAFTLDQFPGPFDVVYLYSVFSHMEAEDVVIYLSAIARATNPGAVLFFTAFVEDNVPPVSVNPPNYVFQKCSGPLHVVRYSRAYLQSMIERSGFSIRELNYGIETNGQSAITAIRSS